MYLESIIYKTGTPNSKPDFAHIRLDFARSDTKSLNGFAGPLSASHAPSSTITFSASASFPARSATGSKCSFQFPLWGLRCFCPAAFLVCRLFHQAQAMCVVCCKYKFYSSSLVACVKRYLMGLQVVMVLVSSSMACSNLCTEAYFTMWMVSIESACHVWRDHWCRHYSWISSWDVSLIIPLAVVLLKTCSY